MCGTVLVQSSLYHYLPKDMAMENLAQVVSAQPWLDLGRVTTADCALMLLDNRGYEEASAKIAKSRMLIHVALITHHDYLIVEQNDYKRNFDTFAATTKSNTTNASLAPLQDLSKISRFCIIRLFLITVYKYFL